MHSEEKTKDANRKRRFFARARSRAARPYLVIGLLLLVAVVVAGRNIDHHIKAIEFWLAHLGPWGVLAFVGFFVLATSFLVPVTVLCIVAGALFGLRWGVAAVVVGSLLAGALQFVLAHQLLRTPIQRTLATRPFLTAIQRAVRRDQFHLQVLLRLAPLNPATISYLLGAAGVRFWGFLLACLALTPNLTIEVYFGRAGRRVAQMAGGDVQTAHVHGLTIIGELAACGILMAIIWMRARRAVLQAVAETENIAPDSSTEMGYATEG